MASSEDEGETVPRDVSDYKFISSDNEPISFAELPIQWNKGSNTLNGKPQHIFLRGKTDNGVRSLYTGVKAWKFDLSCKKPDISVLSVDGHWIKLLKPRKAFVVIIRTILITVNFLHIVKRKSEISQYTWWDHLSKRFSMFDTRPSENDLIDHISLIHEAVKRDETLKKSKILSAFLKEKPKKRRDLNEDTKPSFIVAGVSESEDQKSEDDAETEEGDDDVCAICDNGGRLYICEGKCMRSFHGTEKDGECECYSLGFTKEQVEALENADFYCKNCEYKQHQCFSCGRLGSSDESSGTAEVVCCINGACGKFYHPDCVAKLLHPKDKEAALEQRQKIAAGEQFTCPVHRCDVCKELEVESDRQLQFAICRRCPRAYHRKCLPRKIAYEDDVRKGRAKIQRAWTGVIYNRILIYCLDHEIDESLWTPVRNHIKFPVPKKSETKLVIESSKMDLLEGTSYTKEDTSGKKDYAKPLKVVQKVFSESKQGSVSRKRDGILPAQGFSKMQKVGVNKNSNKSSTVEGKISLGNKLVAANGLKSEPTEHEKIRNIMTKTKRNNMVTLDDDARKRILNLMKDASFATTLEEIKRRHEAPSTHAHSLKPAVDITLGKVEGSVQALRTALEKLDKGGSVQDAKAVCGKDLLLQVTKWKERLRVYLAPFLYGMRYTSYGRHFTKTDKLRQIVDMLHCYIQDGDTMVDFCCGSNDFSWLLKKKLDEVGKKCSFKNFDIVQAKNDFCFEKRDWMKVKPDELPDGSRLIMGLNPPFGVLANKFINKALQFKPKLLILIVPRETNRLDEKEFPYNLIWEDDQMLAGKSFYLPGSVDDVYDKQIEDWNVNPPPLYLWSCPDWTQKHKAIAEQHGHPFSRKNPTMEDSQECHNNLDKSQHPNEDKHLEEQENNRSQSDNPSEAKLKDYSGKNKRKRESDNKVVTEKTSLSKLSPSEAHLSKHLKTQSSHFGRERSESYNNASPRMGDKGVSGTYPSKHLETQSSHVSPKRSNNDDLPHGQIESVATSAMQRCAPRLDNSNHAQITTSTVSSAVDSYRHSLGTRPVGSQGGGPLGFAPGTCLPFFQHGSVGWLDE